MPGRGVENTGAANPAVDAPVGLLPVRNVAGSISDADVLRAKEESVIEGGRIPSIIQWLGELWASRDVISAFAERNVRLKYKQAVLGVAWALIQPLAFLAIFVAVFSRMKGAALAGVPYPAFAMSSLIPWVFVQTAVATGSQALLSDGVLIKKVYFAREAPILGAVLAASLDFALGLGLLLILGPLLGLQFSWTILLTGALWLVLFVLASGVALTLGAVSVYYRDFRYVVPFLLQLWMFASPVAYPVALLPARWRLTYVVANPAAGVLDGFRRVLAEGRPPDPVLLSISLLESVIIVYVGYWIFKHLEAGFADAV